MSNVFEDKDEDDPARGNTLMPAGDALLDIHPLGEDSPR